MPTTPKTPPPSPESGQTPPTPEQPITEQPTTEAQPQVQPQSQESGSVTVGVSFPYSELNGEGFPTITTEGTQLNPEELKAAQKAAEEMGIPLTVEGGGQNG